MRAAIYARFSTDRQSESSIEDQYRVCSERCAKEGLQVVARFEDQGISGAAIGNRPGFLAMTEAANAARFDVLLVMDLTRLSRSQGDLSKVIDRLTARGIRVVGVQDGYDNARKGHKLQAGLSGIIGEAFREMVSERTYTALQSRAMQGKSAGGKVYGYGDGEAEVVRQVFAWYASGRSPAWIAVELNRRGVASPGAAWKRSTRRRGGWAPSAIAGDAARGVGILNCERYIGRTIWNRSKWVKDPDTGKRRQVMRPRSEWIVNVDEAGRIVDQATWDAVKLRQRQRRATVGDKVRKGLAHGVGRQPRYAFSTLIKCEVCGSNIVMGDKRSYVCSGHVNGRICSNNIRCRKDLLEDKLTTKIRTDLLAPETIEELRQRVARALRKPNPARGRRQQLEREVANIVEAIGQGPALPRSLCPPAGRRARTRGPAGRRPGSRRQRGYCADYAHGGSLPAPGRQAARDREAGARRGAEGDQRRRGLDRGRAASGSERQALLGCKDGAGTPAPSRGRWPAYRRGSGGRI
jgi:site-specific DNA recombinase